MKPHLIFNHPAGIGTKGEETIETLALLDDFNACAARFVKTYQQFPAWSPHKLVILVMNGKADAKLRSIYEGIPCDFLEYRGDGWDLGAYQWAVKQLPNECEFVVCMTSRTYFHRGHWLERMIDARKKFGDGLYGAMASLEACPLTPDDKPNPHIRTGFFGMNPRAFAGYPFKVESREDGFKFESGDMSITNWFTEQKKPVKMVCFDGCYDQAEWRTAKNVFRKGDQSNLLAWDRHCAIYDAACAKDRKFLQTISDGGTPE